MIGTPQLNDLNEVFIQKCEAKHGKTYKKMVSLDLLVNHLRCP